MVIEPRRPRRAGPGPRQPQRGATRASRSRSPTSRRACAELPARRRRCMSDTALSQAELVVETIAQTAVDNEKYFCDLDAVVGDGDFGYSLARGFEIVLERLGRAGVRRHRRPAQEDRARPDQAHRRHLGPDLGHRVPARRRGARGQSGSVAPRSHRRAARRDRGNQAARQRPTSATRRCSTRSSRRPTSWRQRSRDGAAGARSSGRRRPRARAPRRPRECSPSAGRVATRASAAATRWTPARWRSR